jgi:hypothetical protein
MMILRVITGFLIAIVVLTIGMSMASTWTVLSGLSNLGVEIPLTEAGSTYLQDIVGMAPLLGGINALGLAVGFLVAALIIRFLWRAPVIGFTLAGAVAVLAELYLMKYNFDITPIAGARSMVGQGLMASVGALAGLIFARFARAPSD